MLSNMSWSITIKAQADLSSPKDLGKAVTLLGDFAAAGRPAIGLLDSNGTSGTEVKVIVAGLAKYLSYQGNSFGASLMVQGSGYLATLASGGFEVGKCVGADGPADNTNPTSGMLGVGLFNFAKGILFVSSVVAFANSEAVI